MNGTENSGFVEVYLFGHWRGVCGRTWDMLDAVVACRELGYLTFTASYIQKGYYQRVWPYSFACTGHESTLMQCGMAETNYCPYRAFVNCSSEYTSCALLILFLIYSR